MNAIWDDEGALLQCPPVEFGRWQPEGELLDFDGFVPTATWELRIEDYEALAAGTLVDWSVDITCSEPGACCLPDGGCVVTDDLTCIGVLDGVYQGDGSTCDEVACEVRAMPCLLRVALGLLLALTGSRLSSLASEAVTERSS